MPAIAPPERPVVDFCPPDPPPAVELGAADEVLEGKTGGMDTVVGRWTFWQRDSTLALIQQVSVELVVPLEQKRQSPSRLLW